MRAQPDGLIYLAQVSEGPIPLEDYFAQERFRCKRPYASSERGRAGDNIYMRRGGALVQQHNFHHGAGDVQRDTRGRNVLVCRKFFYFGRNTFLPPGGWAGFLVKPPARTFYCPDDFADKLLRELDLLGIPAGVIAMPSEWQGAGEARREDRPIPTRPEDYGRGVRTCSVAEPSRPRGRARPTC